MFTAIKDQKTMRACLISLLLGLSTTAAAETPLDNGDSDSIDSKSLPLPLSGDGGSSPRSGGEAATPNTPTNPNNKASIVGSQQVTIDFVDTPLVDLVKFIRGPLIKNYTDTP